MVVSKIALYKARTKSLKETLERASQNKKEESAGVDLIEIFNALIKEISNAYLDLENSLPLPIALNEISKRHSISPIIFLDLEILTQRILSLLESVDENQLKPF